MRAKNINVYAKEETFGGLTVLSVACIYLNPGEEKGEQAEQEVLKELLSKIDDKTIIAELKKVKTMQDAHPESSLMKDWSRTIELLESELESRLK